MIVYRYTVPATAALTAALLSLFLFSDIDIALTSAVISAKICRCSCGNLCIQSTRAHYSTLRRTLPPVLCEIIIYFSTGSSAVCDRSESPGRFGKCSAASCFGCNYEHIKTGLKGFVSVVPVLHFPFESCIIFQYSLFHRT